MKQGNEYDGTIEIRRVGIGWIITEKPEPWKDRKGRQWTLATEAFLLEFVEQWAQGKVEDPCKEKSGG